jgi:hypothetical protein
MKHTAKNMVPAIGATVHISTGVGEIVAACRVEDVKSSWGNIRLLVSPVAGSGSAWVELSRLRRVEVSAAVAVV